MGGRPSRVQLHAKRARQQPRPQQQQCAVCLMPRDDRQTPWKRLRCGHGLHQPCWGHWQSTEHGYGKASTCPRCRAQINPAPAGMQVQERQDPYAVDQADSNLMRLTRRLGRDNAEDSGAAGEADDEATTRGMMRILRRLPPQLVARLVGDADTDADTDDLVAEVTAALSRAPPVQDRPIEPRHIRRFAQLAPAAHPQQADQYDPGDFSDDDDDEEADGDEEDGDEEEEEEDDEDDDDLGASIAEIETRLDAGKRARTTAFPRQVSRGLGDIVTGLSNVLPAHQSLVATILTDGITSDSMATIVVVVLAGVEDGEFTCALGSAVMQGQGMRSALHQTFPNRALRGSASRVLTSYPIRQFVETMIAGEDHDTALRRSQEQVNIRLRLQ
jgi:hypothetical protein